MRLYIWNTLSDFPSFSYMHFIDLCCNYEYRIRNLNLKCYNLYLTIIEALPSKPFLPTITKELSSLNTV